MPRWSTSTLFLLALLMLPAATGAPSGTPPKCDSAIGVCVEFDARIVDYGCGARWCSVAFEAWANGYGFSVRPPPDGPDMVGRTWVNSINLGKTCTWDTPLGCATEGQVRADYFLPGETTCRDFVGIAKGSLGQVVDRKRLCVTFPTR